MSSQRKSRRIHVLGEYGRYPSGEGGGDTLGTPSATSKKVRTWYTREHHFEDVTSCGSRWGSTAEREVRAKPSNEGICAYGWPKENVTVFAEISGFDPTVFTLLDISVSCEPNPSDPIVSRAFTTFVVGSIHALACVRRKRASSRFNSVFATTNSS